MVGVEGSLGRQPLPFALPMYCWCLRSIGACIGRAPVEAGAVPCTWLRHAEPSVPHHGSTRHLLRACPTFRACVRGGVLCRACAPMQACAGGHVIVCAHVHAFGDVVVLACRGLERGGLLSWALEKLLRSCWQRCHGPMVSSGSTRELGKCGWGGESQPVTIDHWACGSGALGDGRARMRWR